MQLVPVDSGAPDASVRYRSALEEGDILFFPRTPFEVPADDRDFLMGVSAVGAARHKNVAYRPHINKVTGFDKTSPGDAERLRSILSSYSRQVLKTVGDLLPEYRAAWKVDYASFRSEEEQGRQLPWKKRNDLLHVDAFPSRPTNGDLILRVFSNINPSKSRVWLTSDPFEPLARQ
jgi:3-deoxy-D-manno-octulosonic acid hydroxylase-like protein